jgi:hypothetical protein
MRGKGITSKTKQHGLFLEVIGWKHCRWRMIPGSGHHTAACRGDGGRSGSEGPDRIIAIRLSGLPTWTKVGVGASKVTVGDGRLHSRQGTVGLEAGLVQIRVVHVCWYESRVESNTEAVLGRGGHPRTITSYDSVTIKSWNAYRVMIEAYLCDVMKTVVCCCDGGSSSLVAAASVRRWFFTHTSITGVYCLLFVYHYDIGKL